MPAFLVAVLALGVAWHLVDPLAPAPPMEPARVVEEPAARAIRREGEIPRRELEAARGPRNFEHPYVQPRWERVDSLVLAILETGESAEYLEQELGELIVSQPDEFDDFMSHFVRMGDYKDQPVTCALIAAIMRFHPEPERSLASITEQAPEIQAYLASVSSADPPPEEDEEADYSYDADHWAEDAWDGALGFPKMPVIDPLAGSRDRAPAADCPFGADNVGGFRPWR
jgi:hypothetical protein